MSETYKQLPNQAGSPFETVRRTCPIPVIQSLCGNNTISPVVFRSEPTPAVSSDIRDLFPNLVAGSHVNTVSPTGDRLSISGKRIAVLFSGGPASGGHNVIVGLWRVLGPHNTLIGVKNGPKGLISGDFMPITDADIARVVNLGGFDLLGSDRTKIKSESQIQSVVSHVKAHQLDGIVVIGGDDSNTNAAILAEHLAPIGCTVVGVPKTIDGDLQVPGHLPISFGYDTATKIYAELVGNILQDSVSSRKYWHFIKIMGRSASQVTLEVALQTHPPVTLISEEILSTRQSLESVVEGISQTILERAIAGMGYGVVLIPEGLLEFIPEFQALIQSISDKLGEIGETLAGLSAYDRSEMIANQLDVTSAAQFRNLPGFIREILVQDRDSHGNLKVSQVPTDQLLIEMVGRRIAKIQASPKTEVRYLGSASDAEIEQLHSFEFSPLSHFFGYEGRCGAPSRFDSALTFNLGLVAGSLVLGGHTGTMAAVSDLSSGGKAVGVSILSLLNTERRHGKSECVIKKALVELDSPAFTFFVQNRQKWAESDCFMSPGPRQMWGSVANEMPILVALNSGYGTQTFDLGSKISPTEFLSQ